MQINNETCQTNPCFRITSQINVGAYLTLPIIARYDNVGAIFKAENLSSEVGTRHVETRYHFVCEQIEDHFIKIVYISFCENDADFFTKNVVRMLTQNM
jgi:hypothetical protein